MSMVEVIGNGNIREALHHSMMQGRVSHAQMFVAPEGAGALAVAIDITAPANSADTAVNVAVFCMLPDER